MGNPCSQIWALPAIEPRALKIPDSARRLRRQVLGWSPNMVHCAPRRPPRLEKKSQQAKDF